MEAFRGTGNVLGHRVSSSSSRRDSGVVKENVIDLTLSDDDEDDVMSLSKKKKDSIDLLSSSDEEAQDDCLASKVEEVAKLRELRRGQWTDWEFPASKRSIVGNDDEDLPPQEKVRVGEGPPRCRCGQLTAMTAVKRDSPNHGRTYYHCATRRCGYFAWTDGEEPRSRMKVTEWRRLGHPLTVDGLFAASDLRQGHLGDCWFLSALAVVGERRDLIARLFVDISNDSGPYACRFFLDGKWRVITVDDQIPMSRKNGELRPAFARCVSSTTGEPTLWASILEKCYAKAHGSYRAISGGQIAEALRDLTGANTISIDIPISAPYHDLNHLWSKLLRWKNDLNLPLGCATSSGSAEGLRGCHAYSILAVKGYRLNDGQECRLLRVRDPHGLSQFPVIDDQGRRVAAALRSSSPKQLDVHDKALLEDASRSMYNDDDESQGTFWIDYARFAAAFSRVDIALAYDPGKFFAQSLDRWFPPSRNPTSRCCGHVVVRSKGRVELSVGAIQPTKRGAWCRDDRKKSYKPGDLSVVVCDLKTGKPLASCFYGAEVGGVEFVCCCRLRGDAIIFCYSLGKNPTAASTTSQQPFKLRLGANGPLDIIHDNTSMSSSVSPAMALHLALAAPPPPDDSRPQERWWIDCGREIACLVVNADGILAVVAVNSGGQDGFVEAKVFCKSAEARDSDDGRLLTNDKEMADKYYTDRSALEKAASIKPPVNRFRFPCQWKCFRTTARVPAHRRRLVMVVARQGVQFVLGDVVCELTEASGGGGRPGKLQTRIDDIFNDPASATRAVFAPVVVDDNDVQARPKKRPRQDDLADAIAASLRDRDDDLARAIELSKQDHQPSSETDDLARAIEQSKNQQPSGETDALARAIDLSMQDQGRPSGEADDLERVLKISRYEK